MSTATASPLPTNELPLIRDPDLASAVESELKGLSGRKLERAQAAIRKVHGSGVTGMFGEILSAYQVAIRESVASD